MSLARMLREIDLDRDEDEDEDEGNRPLPEATVNDLRIAFANYGACNFKPGDLVTPRRGYNVKGAGEPHIVLEVPEAPVFVTSVSEPNDIGSHAFGHRCNMRVACRMGQKIAAFWVESYAFETYTGAGA